MRYRASGAGGDYGCCLEGEASIHEVVLDADVVALSVPMEPLLAAEDAVDAALAVAEAARSTGPFCRRHGALTELVASSKH